MRDVSCIQVIRDGVQPIQTPGKCDSETKPASLHECNKHPCHSHWHTGDWSIVSYKTISTSYYILSHI